MENLAASQNRSRVMTGHIVYTVWEKEQAVILYPDGKPIL